MWKISLYTGLLLTIIALPASTSAQDDAYGNGYFHRVDGDVTVQRATSPDTELGEINVPVLPGDRVWTAANAFAEIRLADGSILRLGEATKVDLMALGTAPSLSLWNGSVIVNVGAERPSMRIDTPAGSFHPQSSGTYRVDVRDGITMTVSTITGVAELASEQGSVLVRAGQRSVIDAGSTPAQPFGFDTARWDAFDTWSYEAERRTSHQRAVPLAELPTEVHHYVDDLDDHGSWRNSREHGYVWYPSVSQGWAPYRHGRWGYTSYGYTWISHEPWGWAPYHYGRWGYNHRGWYWVPGRTWGPAWVSFAVGPAWIGWSPLGHYGGPVFNYNTVYYGRDYYRHERNRYHRGRAVPRHVYDHGAGWNFSSKQHFGSRRKARLRVDDVRASAGRARVYGAGAALDRSLTARTRSSGLGALRAPRPEAFERRPTFRARGGNARERTRAIDRSLDRTPEAPRSTERARSRVFRSNDDTRPTSTRGDRTRSATTRNRAIDGSAFAAGVNRESRARTRSGAATRSRESTPRRTRATPTQTRPRRRTFETTQSAPTRNRQPTRTEPSSQNRSERMGSTRPTRPSTIGSPPSRTSPRTTTRGSTTRGSRRPAMTRQPRTAPPTRSRQGTVQRSPTRSRQGSSGAMRSGRTRGGNRAPAMRNGNRGGSRSGAGVGSSSRGSGSRSGARGSRRNRPRND